ncbi:hypothetical protein [Tahibacter sp.]|uniref:hypothetical protein n=1 Tax=Tahibacter sp. TaxID=2056211 RepID=UPI0028C48CEE|nr:hypothetical protein [Tahibacter sp.]
MEVRWSDEATETLAARCAHAVTYYFSKSGDVGFAQAQAESLDKEFRVFAETLVNMPGKFLFYAHKGNPGCHKSPSFKGMVFIYSIETTPFGVEYIWVWDLLLPHQIELV